MQVAARAADPVPILVPNQLERRKNDPVLTPYHTVHGGAQYARMKLFSGAVAPSIQPLRIATHAPVVVPSTRATHGTC